MPEYVSMAWLAHKLIGEKANLGTAEEVFDLEQGFIKSEAVAGLTALSSGATIAPTTAATASGSIAGAPIILAGDESSSERQQYARAAVASSAAASNLTPSLVESTPAKKRSYQGQQKRTVPDAAVFNEYIIKQEQREERRDQRSIEMWSGVKDVAEKFLGAAVSMMNTWQQQQQQQQSYHGPPPPGPHTPYHYQHSYGPPPSVASTVVTSSPAAGSTSNKRKRTGEEQESHGEKKHRG
ncbi:unnamed protein product [Pseudo-nitzschia multistriata]|uniref:Uncharacterized protein n=1 Tax=Pseudo-nitzschia multistriata TaxID=183589 RepID=A0A448ZNS8_9STRA|nr:unnamed protein product [Pseudo-nitzschia multistriata]